jgi:hypothetical protein
MDQFKQNNWNDNGKHKARTKASHIVDLIITSITGVMLGMFSLHFFDLLVKCDC